MRKIPFLLILLIIPLGLAYAERTYVDVPFSSPWNHTTIGPQVGDGYLIYSEAWIVDLPDDVIDAIQEIKDRADILPPEEIDEGIKIILKVYFDFLTKPQAELEPELSPQMKALEEKKAELEEETKQTLTELDDCLAELERFKRIQQEGYIESLRIPTSFYAIDDYATFQDRVKVLANLNLAACNAMIAFQDQITRYENLGIDEPEIITLHEVEVKTLTIKQQERADYLQKLKDEEQRMIDEVIPKMAHTDPNVGCKVFDERDMVWMENELGESELVSKCEARGNPEPIITDIAGYNKYVEALAASKLTPESYAKFKITLKESQCVVFYPMYQHKVEIPEWLDHCLTAAEKLEKQNKLCFIGRERVDCKELEN